MRRRAKATELAYGRSCTTAGRDDGLKIEMRYPNTAPWPTTWSKNSSNTRTGSMIITNNMFEGEKMRTKTSETALLTRTYFRFLFIRSSSAQHEHHSMPLGHHKFSCCKPRYITETHKPGHLQISHKEDPRIPRTQRPPKSGLARPIWQAMS